MRATGVAGTGSPAPVEEDMARKVPRGIEKVSRFDSRHAQERGNPGKTAATIQAHRCQGGSPQGDQEA